jgi:catabolite regulation protein CreA
MANNRYVAIHLTELQTSSFNDGERELLTGGCEVEQSITYDNPAVVDNLAEAEAEAVSMKRTAIIFDFDTRQIVQIYDAGRNRFWVNRH